MEINGVAHLVLRVTRFGECVDFYDQLMPELGLQAVHRREGFVYYVGGRTALGVRQADSEHADHAHVETVPGSTISASEPAAAPRSITCTCSCDALGRT
jgi:catechol 2,3-dioxygenase-like lactoylglutathione lyase family enzyme